MSKRELTILGCSSQQPTRFRNHSAYIVRWNTQGLLFDPGEGTQRQFIFANIAPTCVNRLFISHFHGDHCLGAGSMLMRLNLDKVKHPIHCYYPASGKKYFDRLRFGTIYHESIQVIEHPIHAEGIVHQDEHFCIEAFCLDHGGVDCYGYRITEPDERKFVKDKLDAYGIKGPIIKQLEKEQQLLINGTKVKLEEVSWIRKGDVFSFITDTVPCKGALACAKNARLLLCESTYLEEHKQLAKDHHHMTAKQAALLAKEAGAKELVLTHFSARYLSAKLFEQEARAVFPNTKAAEDLKSFSFPKALVKK